METPIHQLLQLSKQEYELHKDGIFLLWADINCISFLHLQSIMTNNKIYRWFNAQIAYEERNFIDSLKDISNVNELSAQALRRLYNSYVTVPKYSPKALLNSCKLNISQLNHHQSQITSN